MMRPIAKRGIYLIPDIDPVVDSVADTKERE